jgi:hypothetical protein
LTEAAQDSLPQVRCQSAIEPSAEGYFDTIITDPPYYDAISYANIMDFFYVWHRRTLHGLTSDFDQTFAGEVAPKWAEARNDGELVDDATRFGGDKQRSRIAYEDGMFRAFQACRKALRAEGRLVVVFANKHPEAWEALLSAIIRAGYVVVGSWPIQTERVVRMRSLTSAALSSSIWLICRKRPDSARPGWDNQVLLEMRARIHERLLDFWDAGIRGPDFVWAATGPALEAYSKHPVVKKANEPGTLMVVSEFLRQVRRMVVDFVVGRVLSKNGDGANTSGLDDVTTYYLLHRHDFGFRDVPAGACILYAVSCGLSDSALANEYDLIAHTGRIFNGEDDEEEEASNAEQSEAEPEEGYGSVVRLKTWDHRRGSALGYEKNGRPAPMIDRIHRLMHLWRDGDIVLVDSYLYEQNLPRNSAFHQVLQALVELSQAGSEERSLLESISNHIAAKGGHVRGPKSISEYGSPNPEEKGASHE